MLEPRGDGNIRIWAFYKVSYITTCHQPTTITIKREAQLHLFHATKIGSRETVKGRERNQNKNEKLTQWNRLRVRKLIKVKVLFFVLSKKKFMMRNAINVLDYINETENIQKYVRYEQHGMF
jgi:hypothetical protein